MNRQEAMAKLAEEKEQAKRAIDLNNDNPEFMKRLNKALEDDKA